MSPSSDEPAPMHAQPQSKFFTVPAEIRSGIYQYFVPEGIHLFMLNGIVHASECIRRHKDDDPDCRAHRTFKDEYDSTTDHGASLLPYYRHLCSPWATHWRCDEAVWELYGGRVAGRGVFPKAILETCRRLTYEMVEYMADHVIINLNNMDMVEAFVAAAKLLPPGPGVPETWLTSSDMGFLLSGSKEIHVELRLPYDHFQVLEKTNDEGHTPSKVFDAWMDLPRAIYCLAKPQRLRIWLDHDGKGSWSSVNQRAMLASLARLSEFSCLDIEVNLPQLHPKFESSERHFTDESPKPAFKIHRRYRQRHHMGRQGDWFMGVTHEPDFPILYDLAGPEKGQYECGDMTMEELEACERDMWREGLHPYDETSDGTRCRLERLRDVAGRK